MIWRYRWVIVIACVLDLGGHAEAVPEDADGDLIPDVWEQTHGLNSSDPTDAEVDSDGDRLTSRDEYYAGTDPRTFNAAASMSERQILDLFKGKAFLYFWEQSRAPHHFTPDNAHFDDRTHFSNNFNSIATTGFALMSNIIADELGWMNHQAVYERVRTTLARAVALQQPAYDRLDVPPALQGNRHGYLYHFVDNQGFRYPGSEISTIDHALFVAGALAAAEYYRGTEAEQLARQLFLSTDWNWLFDGMFFYQGWLQDPAGTFEGGRTLDRWDRYSELLVLLIEAMGHPTSAFGVPSSAWDAQTRGTGRMFPNEYVHLSPGSLPQNFGFVPNMPHTLDATGFRNSSTQLHYLHAGSLHNHQYSHSFLDFRGRRDRYRTDFFANSISATMVNRQFCIALNLAAFGGDPLSPDPTLRQPYETYGPQSWGLMAGVSSDGYKVLQPIVASGDDFSVINIRNNTDSSTVILSAALGSTPFTPRQAIDFTRNMLVRFQARQSGYDALVGRYGFRNAFNLGRTATGQIGHFPVDMIGLDLGPVAGSIENFETGLIWKWMLRNAFIQSGLQKAGFPTGHVEPFVLNFDDNPPAPHEDPNGGGQDPHSFGGSSFAFGSGTIAYLAIGDPLPGSNFGPQQWAQRISATNNNDSGAFFSLNNHSVSQADRLSFWIKGAAGTESYSVGLKDRVRDRLGNSLQPVEVKLPVASYHPVGQITTAWTEVRIPLREFASRGVRLTELDNISLTCTNPAGGTVEIDDIAFLGDEFAPAAPMGLAATVSGPASVALSWSPSLEPDVVGYRVYRSSDCGQTSQPLNTLLVVGTTYTDAGVAPGRSRYGVAAVDNAPTPNSSAPLTNATEVVVPDSANLLSNGNFESGKTGWLGWGTNKVLTTQTVFDGCNAAAFRYASTGARALTHALVPVTAGRRYEARAMLKTINATGNAFVKLQWKAAGGTTLSVQDFGHTQGATDWLMRSSGILTAPAGATHLKLQLVTRAGSGTAYFDSVRVDTR